MVKEEQVFRAIAHPARRGILDLLSCSSLSVKELTARFDISQPAVSQHLKELREAELVASERDGLEQRYRLTPAPLGSVVRWADRYRTLIDPSGHVWSLDAAAAERAKVKKRRRRADGR